MAMSHPEFLAVVFEIYGCVINSHACVMSHHMWV